MNVSHVEVCCCVVYVDDLMCTRRTTPGCLCVETSYHSFFKPLAGKNKSHPQCFPKDGVCFVTYGDAKDQTAARKFCASLPGRPSVLPTITSHSRKLVFDQFLGNASAVTNNQPVWLDIHKKQTQGLI